MRVEKYTLWPPHLEAWRGRTAESAVCFAYLDEGPAAGVEVHRPGEWTKAVKEFKG